MDKGAGDATTCTALVVWVVEHSLMRIWKHAARQQHLAVRAGLGRGCGRRATCGAASVCLHVCVAACGSAQLTSSPLHLPPVLLCVWGVS